MADPTKTGLTLVGNGEEFKRLFENLNPEDRVAFLEALQHQMIQKELEDRREQIGEEGYGTLLERYGRADMEHMLAQKPWLYRNVGITALARRTKTNDQERPEVLRRVREILVFIGHLFLFFLLKLLFLHCGIAMAFVLAYVPYPLFHIFLEEYHILLLQFVPFCPLVLFESFDAGELLEMQLYLRD